MGIDINDINITLLFIFYFETKKENNYLNGVKISNEKKINFFLFSNDDKYFFKYDKGNFSIINNNTPDNLNINKLKNEPKRDIIYKSNEKYYKLSDCFKWYI